MFLACDGGGQLLPQEGTPCLVTLLDCSEAFDMCKFDLLFEKLHRRNIPPIVLRTLIFIYEEQTARVRWGKARSCQFGIKNGTRQGSVLSPAFYIDDLLT